MPEALGYSARRNGRALAVTTLLWLITMLAQSVGLIATKLLGGPRRGTQWRRMGKGRCRGGKAGREWRRRNQTMRYNNRVGEGRRRGRKTQCGRKVARSGREEQAGEGAGGWRTGMRTAWKQAGRWQGRMLVRLLVMSWLAKGVEISCTQNDSKWQWIGMAGAVMVLGSMWRGGEVGGDSEATTRGSEDTGDGSLKRRVETGRKSTDRTRTATRVGWLVRLMIAGWLVRGVGAMESAGAPGEGGAVAAGVAALAALAAKSMGSAFWEAGHRVTRDVGDVKLDMKQTDTMRLVVGNIRRVKQMEGSAQKETDMRKVEEMTEALSAMQADVVGLVDTGLEDGTTPGQAGLWGAGQLRTAMEQGWGGSGMIWKHAQGRKTKTWQGGVAHACCNRWKGAAGRWGVDKRGMGRYNYRELVGTNGQTLVVAMLYLATESSAEGAWMHQKRWMQQHKEELQRREKEGPLSVWDEEVLRHLEHKGPQEPNPKTLALMELRQELLRLKCEYVVVAGDWNTGPPGERNARGGVERTNERRDRETVEIFAKELGLVEPMRRRLQGGPVPVTCVRGEGGSWIDYYLVSEKLVSRGLIRGAGVVGDRINDSDHRLIVLDLDAGAMLGKSRLWEDIMKAVEERRESNMNAKFKAVQLRKEERVQEFQKALAQGWEEGGLELQIKEFREWVDWLGEAAWEEGGQQRTLEEQGSCIMEQVEAVILAAQESVQAKLPKAGNRFKHQMTPEMVKLMRRVRALERLQRAIQARVPRAVLKGVVEKLRERGVGLPIHRKGSPNPNAEESWGMWDDFSGKVGELMERLKRHTHGADRKRMKELRQGRQDRLERAMEPGPDQDMGKAIDNVLKRVRDGAVDTAILTMQNEGGRRRAAESGQEVVDYTLNYAQEWMGRDRECWFHFEHGCTEGMREKGARWEEGDRWHLIAQDTEAGRDFRERLVEGKLTVVDKASIPECFHCMLKYLERKVGHKTQRKVEASDYEECELLEDISEEGWRAFWSKAGAGKRGGASGVHATLVKAMMKEVWEGPEGGSKHSKTDHVVEGLRLLVNASRAGRFYYVSWRQELLYFFIKTPGATGLENSRPVGLLEVLLKACYAMDFGKIATVWERVGFLEESQYAFIRGRGTEGPLMLWLLMNERAYQTKEDQARGQGDLKHAYDGVFMWAVEVILMRAGLPAKYVKYAAKLIRETRTAVITPFGLTAKFRRGSGLPQGGPQSCGEWNAYIDVMAEMQKGMAREQGVRLEGEWGQVIELLVQMFADDTHHCAAGSRCVQGLEERFEIATLWATFFGAEHRAEKCSAVIGRWTKEREANDRTLKTQDEHGERIKVRDALTGKVEYIGMVDPYEDCRALGVQVSMAGYGGEAVEKATREAEVTARAITKAPKVANLAEMTGRAVGWQRLKYRLLLVYAFPEMVRVAARSLKVAVTRAVGLPPGTALAALHTMIWPDAGQEILLDRVAMLLRVLVGGGVVGSGLRGSIQELQRWAGTELPVLETDVARCKCVEADGAEKPCSWKETAMKPCKTSCGWNGSWVAMLHRTMSEEGITIRGGLGLPKLREGDMNLVDMAGARGSKERELVRRGCHAAEVWRLSEVMDLEGRGMVSALLRGGGLEKQVGWHGQDWGQEVRSMVQEQIDGGRTLGPWRRDAVHGWKLAVWAQAGRLQVGIPVGPSDGEGIRVRKLGREKGGEGTRQMRREVRRGRVKDTFKSIVWRMGRHTREEEVVLWRGEFWPTVATWVDEGGDASWVALEQVGAQCQQAVYNQQCDAMPAVEMLEEGWQREWSGEGFIPGHCSTPVSWIGGHLGEGCGWGEGQKAALLGEGWWGVQASTRYEAELKSAREGGEWGTLDVYSDGGADRAGTAEATAEYGWVIGGTLEESLEVWGEGGAPVRGVASDMDSNRAEMYGLLAVMVRTREWGGKLRAWLDNDNVKRGVEKLQGKVLAEELWEVSGMTWEERVAPAGLWYQEVQDRDLWEVMALLVAERGDRLEVRWVRGHSDTRGTRATLNKHQRGNVRADAICNRLKGAKRNESRLQLPRLRSWRACWEGIEVVGKVKTELKKKLDAAKVMRYFGETRGWGAAAEEWLGTAYVGDWFMRGASLGARVRAVRSMYSMWDTSDVRAKRARGSTEQERRELAKCELCGEDSAGVRNWHLLGRCKHWGIVGARKRILEAVEGVVFKAVTDLAQRQVIMLPWALDSEGRLLEMGEEDTLLETLVREVQCDEATGHQVGLMCRVVQGGGDQERRQMVYKGMMGRAWVELLVGWGMKQHEATRLKTKLLKMLQLMVPEIEGARWREVSKQEASCSTGEAAGMVEAALNSMQVGEGGHGVGRWRAESGARVRSWQASKQLAWAVRVLTHRRGVGGQLCREVTRAQMEGACGKRLRVWLGAGERVNKTRWKPWKQMRGRGKRQTVLDFGKPCDWEELTERVQGERAEERGKGPDEEESMDTEREEGGEVGSEADGSEGWEQDEVEVDLEATEGADRRLKEKSNRGWKRRGVSEDGEGQGSGGWYEPLVVQEEIEAAGEQWAVVGLHLKDCREGGGRIEVWLVGEGVEAVRQVLSGELRSMGRAEDQEDEEDEEETEGGKMLREFREQREQEIRAWDDWDWLARDEVGEEEPGHSGEEGAGGEDGKGGGGDVQAELREEVDARLEKRRRGDGEELQRRVQGRTGAPQEQMMVAEEHDERRGGEKWQPGGADGGREVLAAKQETEMERGGRDGTRKRGERSWSGSDRESEAKAAKGPAQRERGAEKRPRGEGEREAEPVDVRLAKQRKRETVQERIQKGEIQRDTG